MTLKEYQAQLIAALTPESLAEMRSLASGFDGTIDPDKGSMATRMGVAFMMCHFAEVDIDEIARLAVAEATNINAAFAEGEQ